MATVRSAVSAGAVRTGRAARINAMIRAANVRHSLPAATRRRTVVVRAANRADAMVNHAKHARRVNRGLRAMRRTCTVVTFRHHVRRGRNPLASYSHRWTPPPRHLVRTHRVRKTKDAVKDVDVDVADVAAVIALSRAKVKRRSSRHRIPNPRRTNRALNSPLSRRWLRQPYRQ